jgi:lipopolysaccharide transport system permease protein
MTEHSAMTAGDLPVTRIRPSSGWSDLGLADLWHYRELILFLTWREIQVRYKQTLLGVAWIVVQPLATTLIFTVIFGMLARIPSDGLPYPLFAMAGLVPWNFFASAYSRGSVSLVGSANLISKVYFPRLAIPISSALSPVVDVGVSMIVLVGLALYYGFMPTLTILMVVPLLLLTWLVGLGVALWLSALNVRYRDVGHLIPFVTQLWFYATPVIYPVNLIPPQYRVWQGLNPLATVVEGFRWAVLGKAPPEGTMVLISLVVAAMLLVGGAYAFRRMERTFADLV